MPIAYISSYLNGLSAKALCVAFVVSALTLESFETSQSTLGKIAHFFPGFVLFTVLILWPWSVLRSMKQDVGSNVARKVLSFSAVVIFFGMLFVNSSNILVDYDVKAFLREVSPFGIFLVFVACLTIYGQLFLFYNLEARSDANFATKFNLGMKYILLFIFFPVGIFYIKRIVDIYWSQQRPSENMELRRYNT